MIVLISHASKVMHKNLQVKALTQHVNWALPDVQDGLKKGRGARDEIANICWVRESKVIKKKIYFCFIDYVKAFVWIIKNCGKFLKRWEYHSLLLASWEIHIQVRKQQLITGHGTVDWFKVGKGLCLGCILSPCLFNIYAEYIMWNARLGKSKAGIKISGKNTLRFADDITLMVEREEELKSILMKVKEESEKSWLKTQY